MTLFHKKVCLKDFPYAYAFILLLLKGMVESISFASYWLDAMDN
jgi:hypothetical protein